MYDILELNNKLLFELRDIAKNLKIKRVESLRKQDLVYRILDQHAIVASGETAKNTSLPDKHHSRMKDKTTRQRIKKHTPGPSPTTESDNDVLLRFDTPVPELPKETKDDTFTDWREEKTPIVPGREEPVADTWTAPPDREK